MKATNERKNGAILSYLSIIISTLIQLIFTPFLIRNLGQSEYGLYSLTSSIIGYLTVLDLGFGNAIVVYTSKYRAQKKYEEEKKLHGMFLVIFQIIGIIAIILGIILFLNINNIFGNTMTEIELYKSKIMMLILTFNLAITFSFSIYPSIITAYEKFTYQKILSIISIIMKPLLMLPLLFFGYKSISLCIIITIINIFVIISNYTFCKNKLNIKIKFSGFDKKLFKTIFGYSFFIFIGILVDKINWSLDQFILGAVSGTVAVSVYSIASQLNSLFINLSTAISGVFLPKISKMVSKKIDSKELTNEMIKVGRIQYYIIFFMASGLVLVGKEFIIWWAGSEFTTSYYVALLLILPLCIPLIQNLGLSIMQAMNKYKFRSMVTLIMAIFNAIISYFLAKSYGTIGAALGTAISLLICNGIIINIYYKKEIKLDIFKFWREIIKMSITFIIPLSIIILIINLTQLNGLLSVIVYGLTYSILFTLTSYFITMNKYEKNLVKDILNKLFKRK